MSVNKLLCNFKLDMKLIEYHQMELNANVMYSFQIVKIFSKLAEKRTEQMNWSYANFVIKSNESVYQLNLNCLNAC